MRRSEITVRAIDHDSITHPAMKIRVFTLLVLLSGGLASLSAAPVTFYDKDPAHQWNRLHSVLMTQAPEGKTVPDDLLDPPHTLRLLSGEPNREALALLGEFVAQPLPETVIPLRRAVLQRDLLAVFHIAVGENYTERTAPQRELITALARAIRHVALTAEEIRKLPDNYTAAASALDAVTTDDPEHPRAFLPKDLLADDGPWIAVNGQGLDSYAGRAHFTFLKGRSSFEVRMRHPGGREAGLAYLKSLADMPQPLVWEKPAEPAVQFNNISGVPRWLNPVTPKFPKGTAWALIRRAILADTKGQPVTSPLVESVQVRVYRSVGTVDSLDSELTKLTEAEQEAVIAKQLVTSFEWEARRSLLLGKGGFHQTTLDEIQYSHFAPIEAKPDRQGRPLTNFCLQCHFTPGIFSIQSRTRQFFNDTSILPLAFAPTDRLALDRAAESIASPLLGWTLLHWLWQ